MSINLRCLFFTCTYYRLFFHVRYFTTYLGIIFLTYASNNLAEDIENFFEKEEIVPDVLDKAPNQLLRVSYNKKPVKNGENWTPTSLIPTPDLEWNYDPNSYYTLVMINPDPPKRERPIYREFLQWMVTNIPGNDFSKGETIVEYVGAGPPKDGGVHRILFTLYKQASKINFDEPHTAKRELGIRMWWSQRNFVRKYELNEPIAALMLFSEYDDYVPQMHKEFMDNIKG